MTKPALAYSAVTVTLTLAGAYLYAKGFELRSESLGLGLSYILLAVTCFGLAVVSVVMAVLESLSAKQNRGQAA